LSQTLRNRKTHVIPGLQAEESALAASTHLGSGTIF